MFEYFRDQLYVKKYFRKLNPVLENKNSSSKYLRLLAYTCIFLFLFFFFTKNYAARCRRCRGDEEKRWRSRSEGIRYSAKRGSLDSDSPAAKCASANEWLCSSGPAWRWWWWWWIYDDDYLWWRTAALPPVFVFQTRRQRCEKKKRRKNGRETMKRVQFAVVLGLFSRLLSTRGEPLLEN